MNFDKNQLSIDNRNHESNLNTHLNYNVVESCRNYLNDMPSLELRVVILGFISLLSIESHERAVDILIPSSVNGSA